MSSNDELVTDLFKDVVRQEQEQRQQEAAPLAFGDRKPVRENKRRELHWQPAEYVPVINPRYSQKEFRAWVAHTFGCTVQKARVLRQYGRVFDADIILEEQRRPIDPPMVFAIVPEMHEDYCRTMGIRFNSPDDAGAVKEALDTMYILQQRGERDNMNPVQWRETMAAERARLVSIYKDYLTPDEIRWFWQAWDTYMSTRGNGARPGISTGLMWIVAFTVAIAMFVFVGALAWK